MSWMDDWNAGKGYGATTSGYTDAKANSYFDEKWDEAQKGGQSKVWKRCWEDNHKPIKILKGEVFGGACAHPQDGYDIYIGLDYGMKLSREQYPWNEIDKDAPVEVLFRITDMCAPKDVKNFKKMITWMVEQLKDGKKIQVGCIGGHGRTGLVLSALVMEAGLVKKHAIQWVRKHHCKDAVESESQVKFLMKHYGVSEADATKAYVSAPNISKSSTSYVPASKRKQNALIRAVKSQGSIW